VEELIKAPQNFIINPGPGKQQHILIDYDKKEDNMMK